MHPYVTYTLLGFWVALFVFGFWVDGRRENARWARVAKFSLVMQLGAIGGGYMTLRPGRGVDGNAAIQAAHASGQLLLLDMYSNW